MRVIVNGLAVEYEEQGSGNATLMLHGWGDTLHTFDDLAGTLSGRIVRLSLPGFGESDFPKNTWTLDDYIRFIKSFIEKLRIHPDILVGHSMGGRIILKGVSTGMLRARKIVLIASAGVAERNTFRNYSIGLLAKIGRILTSVPPFNFMRDRLRKYLYKTIKSDYLSSGALRATFLNIIKEDLSSAAQTITVPTLILWGENDAATPLSEGEKLHGLIRASVLRVIPHAGHFVHQEKPHEISSIIREFV